MEQAALLRLHPCRSPFQTLGRDCKPATLRLSGWSPTAGWEGSDRVAAPHRPPGHLALFVRNGETRLRSGPIPAAERVRGRAVRGVHRHPERQRPVLGKPDGERPDHPEDLVVTRPESGGLQLDGLCRLPGVPRSGRHGHGRLLYGVFLPVQAALDERRADPATSGAVLSGGAGPGPAGQPPGG